jgi:hypothetical protein
MRRNNEVHLKLTFEEKERIVKQADEFDLSICEYLRKVILNPQIINLSNIFINNCYNNSSMPQIIINLDEKENEIVVELCKETKLSKVDVIKKLIRKYGEDE